MNLSKEQKIMKRIDIIQTISVAIFFIGFFSIVLNMIIARYFKWYFLALVLVAAMLVSALIVSIKKKIDSNYKEAISKGLMQLMITLGFVLDVKLLMMCSKTLIKGAFSLNVNFWVLFNLVQAIIFLIYAVVMFILTAKLVFMIIRPVLVAKALQKQNKIKIEDQEKGEK